MAASETIRLDDIMEKFHLTKSYLEERIMPNVTVISKGNTQFLDRAEFSRWLMENATFTRQTKLVPASKAVEYKKLLKWHQIYTGTPSVYDRTSFPHRVVNPFDFYDKPLYFSSDARFKNSMTFQRIMFQSAAVKIKLSEKHIFYYAPALENVLEIKNGKFLFNKASEMRQCIDVNSNTGQLEIIEAPVLLPALDTDVFKAVKYQSANIGSPDNILDRSSITKDKKPNIKVFSNEALFTAFIDTLQNMGMSLKEIQKSFDAAMENQKTR